MNFQTEQESFWSGKFGNEYTERNASAEHEASLLSNFSKILGHTGRISSAIEFGANRGLNLITLKRLVPGIDVAGIEINESAASRLEQIPNAKIYNQSIYDYEPTATYDMSFIRGVLIHINPDRLGEVYDKLYRSSEKWVLVAEYYNPTPLSLEYRGHEDRLFKRDFAGEMLDRFPDLRLDSYGFVYHRDPMFPQDDITWFLLRKNK